MMQTPTYSPTWNRVWIGFCPQCGRLHVIENSGECWPPAECKCGWLGGLPELVEGKVYDPIEFKVKRKPYPGIRAGQTLEQLQEMGAGQ